MTVSAPSAGLAVLGGMLTVLSPCVLYPTCASRQIAAVSSVWSLSFSGWAYYWFCHTESTGSNGELAYKTGYCTTDWGDRSAARCGHSAIFPTWSYSTVQPLAFKQLAETTSTSWIDGEFLLEANSACSKFCAGQFWAVF